jgi:DNA polymerase-3 subunit alpha
MKETEASVQKKLDASDDMDLMVFFGSNNFYIHSYEEMAKNFTEEELEETNKIADSIEDFDIFRTPFIPAADYKCSVTVPKLKYSSESDKFLTQLCIEGSKRIKPWEKTNKPKEEYWERTKTELEVLFDSKLSDYFLLVWDIVQAAKNRPADHSFDWENWKGELDPIAVGPGRGSSGGCLVSYLIGITNVDPIPYGLLFSRFYNAGRKGSLPDIDLDFDTEGRDWLFDYLRWKYSAEKVGQIATFGAIKGKMAIKDLFKIKGTAGGYEKANEICKYIGEESKIIDEIQAMKEDGHEDYGILTWTIDNVSEFRKLSESPEYGELIQQAIRCEGVLRQVGKHAAGIVLSDRPLNEDFPIIWDTKHSQFIIGLDKDDVEKLGGCKVDLLAIASLSKMKMVEQLVAQRKVK